ncbi:MAG: NAD(P)/FAD-dependent oxidoreductase [Bosea sp. (in: a-proteobacteria)]
MTRDTSPKAWNDCDVAVVGGGVVGLSLAWGLARRGLAVTILDEGDIAHRASRGNFALVWVQGKGLDMPEYARWTLRSAELWRSFADELGREAGMDLRYEQRGGLMASLDEAQLDQRTRQLGRLHNAVPDSASVETFDHNAMKELLPDIGPKVVGGTFCPHDGHVNSLKFFSGLHTAATARGAHYRPNCDVAEIIPVVDGFSIKAAGGDVRARKIVLAAGLGNARLAPMIGLDAPVRPQRGQVMVTEKLLPFLHYPLDTLRQTDEGGVMIGASNEEVGFDTGNSHDVLARIAREAVEVFPRLAQVQIVRSWGALRVMSPDGYPIYDRSSACPGGYVVTSHSGITLAAIHNAVIMDAIADDVWPDVLQPFSARRFAHVLAAA